MIIRSIRLKNIKSYGAGENDAGITVDFQPGVNRIAGRNGHGKSTLIEAIGFALFLAKPNYEETFAIDTYLLRNGSKEGEIDVTFEYKGQAFRIERGLGKASKRRTKVIDPQDESICAEGDAEVSEFLRQLLALPSADNLSEIFSKLIGVKQGRLTWPFDSKPTQARNFFEPLFDVAVFRECFDKLKPARDQFDEALQAAKVKNAGVIQKIADRADSKDKLKKATELVQKTEQEEKAALKAADEASQKKGQLESLEKQQAAATTAYESAKNTLTRAEDFLKHTREQLLLSEKAVEAVTRHTPAHQAYHAAEKELTKLDGQREQRDAIKSTRDKTDADRKNLLTRAEAAEAQIKSFNEQKSTKATEQKRFQESFEALNEGLSKTLETFEASAKAIEKAGSRHALIASWVSGITATEKRLANLTTDLSRLENEIASWDPKSLTLARETVEKAEAALTEATARLNQAVERKTTLKAQLAQISGGVCPFLKETCRQFDPKKVQGDLTSAEQAVAELTAKVATAQAALEKAKAVWEPLQVASSQIAGKQESLASRRADFLDELSDFFPEQIRQSMDALSQWAEPIEPPPGYFELPSTALTPEVTTKLHASVTVFVTQIRVWWTATHQHFSDLSAAHDKVRLDRTRDVETRAQLEARITERTDELTRLTELISKKADEKKESIRLAKTCADTCAALDEQLKPFASLPDQIKTQQKRKEENRPGYESFLRAKQVADELSIRKEAVTVAQGKQEEAALGLKEKDRLLKAASEAFDPPKARTGQSRLSSQARGGHVHPDEPDPRPQRGRRPTDPLPRMVDCLPGTGTGHRRDGSS